MSRVALMSDDDLDANVLFYLNQHIGKKNRMDRWELVEKIFNIHVPAPLRNDDHPQDRTIRESVSRLRAKGHLICDLGDGGGRWIAENEAEFGEFYAYYIKPIQARATVARAMKKAAERQFPSILQPSLFGAPVVLEEVEVA